MIVIHLHQFSLIHHINEGTWHALICLRTEHNLVTTACDTSLISGCEILLTILWK